MKYIKITFWSLSIALLVAVVAGAVFIKSFDINSYKQDIELSVTESLGRDFKINGEMGFVFAFSPTIEANDITLANASWGTEKNMLKLAKASVRFSLLNLLRGVVKIDKVFLEAPFVFLETDRKRKANWDFPTLAAESSKVKTENYVDKVATTSGFNFSYELGDIEIEKGTVVYLDGTNNDKNILQIKDLRLDNSGRINLQALLDDKNIEANGKIVSVSDLLNDKNDAQIDVKIVFDTNVLNAKGEIKDIVELKGISLALEAYGTKIPFFDSYKAAAKIKGDSKKLAASDIDITAGDKKAITFTATGNIANVITMGAPNLKVILDAVNPVEFGVKPFKAILNVDEIKNAAAFSAKFNFTAGKSSAEGFFKADMSGKKPDIVANLKSSYFDVEDVFSTSQGQKTADNSVKTATKEDDVFVFSNKPLPIIRLSDANADIKIDFSKLIIPDMAQSSKIKANAVLKDSVLTVSADDTFGEKGILKAYLNINGSKGDTTTVFLKARGENIVLAKLFYNQLGKSISGGATTLDVNLKSEGDSIHTLMGNMNGKFVVLVENVKTSKPLDSILGGDLFSHIVSTTAGLFGVQEEKRETNIQCAVANLNVNKGDVVIAKNVAMETDKAFWLVNGDINFGSERMNLSVETLLQEGLRTGVSDLFSGLVKVSGTFSDPKIKADSKGVANAALSVGAALMTGGMSVLGQKVVSATLQDASPCSTAYGKPVLSSKAYKKAQATAAKKENPKASATQVSSTTDKNTSQKEVSTGTATSKQNPIDAIKSLFKGAGTK